MRCESNDALCSCVQEVASDDDVVACCCDGVMQTERYIMSMTACSHS